MTNHKHVFTKCLRCDICGTSLQQIEEEKQQEQALKEFLNKDTTGKPSARDWDKA